MAERFLIAIEIQGQAQSVLKDLKKDIDGVDTAGKQGAKGVATLSGAIDSAAKSSGALTGMLKGVIQTAGGLLLGMGVMKGFGFFQQATAGASDLAESVSKVQVVFGDSAETIKEWAKTTADTLGQSEAQAYSAAGAFGNFFITLGLGQPQAAEMSKSMVALAGDLASFHNTNPADAIMAMTSAMRGEYESISRYGVLMNEATLKNKAFTMGLVDSEKTALTPQVKAMAAYGLLVEQTATAHGDFGRTAEGNANQMRILQAKIADIRNEIGTALLPILLRFGQFMVGIMPRAMEITKVAITELTPPIKTLANALQVLLPIAIVIALDALATFVRTTTTVIDSAQQGYVSLVKVVTAAMVAILSVVSTVGREIYTALQWLNPFASHSDPLIYSVTVGVAKIQEEFASLDEVGPHLDALGAHVHALGSSLQNASNILDQADLDEKLSAINRTGGEEGVAAFQAAEAEIQTLITAYNELGVQLFDNETALATHTETLDAERVKLDELAQQISATQALFDGLGRTPLLEEEVFDDAAKAVKKDMDEIQLAIIKLKQQGPLTKEVSDGVDSQGKPKYKTVDTAIGKEVKDLEEELAALRLEAQRIDLEKTLAIDPLKDQLNDLSEVAAKPFNEIYNAMVIAKNELAELNTQYTTQAGVVSAAEVEQTRLQEAVDATRQAYEDLGAQIGGQQAIMDQYLDVALKTVAAEDERVRIAEALAAADLKAAEAAAKKAAKEAEDASAGGLPSAEEISAAISGIDTSALTTAREEIEKISQLDPKANLDGAFDPLGTIELTPLQEIQASFRDVRDAVKEFKEETKGVGEFFSDLERVKGILASIALGFGLIAVGAVALQVATVIVQAFTLAIKAARLAALAFNLVMSVNPVVLIVLGIAALIAIIVVLVTHWDDIVERFPLLGEAADAVKDKIEDFTDWLTDTALPAVTGFFQGGLDKIGEFISFVQENWGKVKGAIEPELTLIGTIFSAVFDGIKLYFETWFAVFKGVVEVAMGLFTGDWGRMWDGIKAIVTGIWEGITGAFEIGKQFLIDIVPEIKTAGEHIGGAIKDGFIAGVKGLVGVVGNIADGIFEAIKSLINSAVDSINEMIPDDIGFSVKVMGKGVDVKIPLPPNPLPHLAKGGLIVAGDNPSGIEAVIPFERMGEFLNQMGALRRGNDGGGFKDTGTYAGPQTGMNNGGAIFDRPVSLSTARMNGSAGTGNEWNISLVFPNVRHVDERSTKKLARDLAPEMKLALADLGSKEVSGR